MVDVMLKNGDIELNSMGGAVMLGGFDAAVQRALICLNTRRGSFIYDRSLGVPPLSPGSGCRIDRQRLEMLINEALADSEDIYVEVLSADESLKIRINAENQSRIEEVFPFGDV